MSRLVTIDFQEQPFSCNLFTKAEQGYKGYFHSHGGIELLIVHEGQGSVTIPQHVYRIEPGTVFVFQPYQLHHVRAADTERHPYIRSVFQFDPAALMPFIKPYKQLEKILNFLWKGQLRQQAFPLMEKRYPIVENLRYFHAHRSSDKEKEQEGQAFLLTALLQFLQQEISILQMPVDAAMARSMTHTEAILRWIEQHYMEPFELERLATELHLSKYHISHLFKEETGHSVTEYLLALRSKEACRLLTNSPLSVAEIGARVGWPIASHFIQQFKRWVGCTPLQYRKRNRF
ncbi:helix-turn-helix domain-containing protein [Paenibacillus sp. GCM10027626]|uniref:AraC family transcriptional regulator n=1 Tax=Paenibacillus sp. GCM10027626 TaxID=3273411 RepID=UPI00363CDB4C